MVDQFKDFEQLGPFYDNANYPRGFNKSGEFTMSESELLTRYGKKLRTLESEEIGNQNASQQRFIRVCRGELEAETALEKAWMKYRTKIAQPKIAISPYSSASAFMHEMEEEILDTDFEDE